MAEKGSLEYLGKVIGETKDENVYLSDKSFNIAKIWDLEGKIINALNETKMGESPIATLSSGLCYTLNNSSEPVKNYEVPVALVRNVAIKIVNKLYEDLNEFRNAPLNSDFAKMDSLSYATIQNITKNLKDENKELPANQYVEKFGRLNQSEVPEIYNQFVDDVKKSREIAKEKSRQLEKEIGKLKC